jgi:hypothetical protein
MSAEDQLKLLTEEECAALAELMQKKYSALLNDRKFSIKVSADVDGVLATVLLKNDDDSYVYPVEARMMNHEEEMTPREALAFLIDYIDLYFEEFFFEEDQMLYIPIDWSNYEYEGVTFQMRGQILNAKADAMADQFLKEHDQHLQ